MNPRIFVLTLVTFAFGSGAFIFAGIGALFAIAAGALSLLWFGRLT